MNRKHIYMVIFGIVLVFMIVSNFYPVLPVSAPVPSAAAPVNGLVGNTTSAASQAVPASPQSAGQAIPAQPAITPPAPAEQLAPLVKDGTSDVVDDVPPGAEVSGDAQIQASENPAQPQPAAAKDGVATPASAQ